MEQIKEFMELLNQVVEDGELTYQEIYQIAKWINEHKEARQHWPVKDFTQLLQDAFADGKIDKREANEVGLLIQRVRREWSRKNTSEITPAGESFFATAFQKLKRKATEVGQAIQRSRQEVPTEKNEKNAATLESVVATAIERFDAGHALLPTIQVHVRVQSESEPDTEYTVDLTNHSCSCPDFKSKRKDLPRGDQTKMNQSCSIQRTATNSPRSVLQCVVPLSQVHATFSRIAFAAASLIDGNWLASNSERNVIPASEAAAVMTPTVLPHGSEIVIQPIGELGYGIRLRTVFDPVVVFVHFNWEHVGDSQFLGIAMRHTALDIRAYITKAVVNFDCYIRLVFAVRLEGLHILGLNLIHRLA